MGLQFLQYSGYISIDYGKVVKDAESALDADGDGQLTTNDLVVLWRKFSHIVSFNVPGGSGFATGFYIGIRYGF